MASLKKALALLLLFGESYLLTILRNGSLAEGSRSDVAILIISTLAFPSFAFVCGLAIAKAKANYAHYQEQLPGVQQAHDALDACRRELKRKKAVIKTHKKGAMRQAHERVEAVIKQAVVTLLHDDAVQQRLDETAQKMAAMDNVQWMVSEVGARRSPEEFER